MRATAGALFLLGQSLDALTFVVFFTIVPVSFAMVSERNPTVLALLAFGGVALVAVVKVAAGLLVWRSTRRQVRQRLPGWAYRHVLATGNVLLAIALASGYVGAAFNFYAIAQVLRL